MHRANATLLWSCFLFSFVCEIFHWHVLEIPGSLVWRCWVIQTGLQESESGCKSVLSGGPGVGSDTIAGGGVGVDGGAVCKEGCVVPTLWGNEFSTVSQSSVPPSTNPWWHTLGLRCRDTVSHTLTPSSKLSLIFWIFSTWFGTRIKLSLLGSFALFFFTLFQLIHEKKGWISLLINLLMTLWRVFVLDSFLSDGGKVWKSSRGSNSYL